MTPLTVALIAVAAVGWVTVLVLALVVRLRTKRDDRTDQTIANLVNQTTRLQATVAHGQHELAQAGRHIVTLHREIERRQQMPPVRAEQDTHQMRLAENTQPLARPNTYGSSAT